MNWFQLLGIALIFGTLSYLWYAVTTRRGIGTWLHQRKVLREIQLVEKLAITTRSSVFLIDVRGQSFLVGHSPQSLQIISLPQSSENGSTKDVDVEPKSRNSNPSSSDF